MQTKKFEEDTYFDRDSPDNVNVIRQLRQLAEGQGRRSLPKVLVVYRQDGQVAFFAHSEPDSLEFSVAAPTPHLRAARKTNKTTQSNGATAVQQSRKNLSKEKTSDQMRILDSIASVV